MKLFFRNLILLLAFPFLGQAQADYQNEFSWVEKMEIPAGNGQEVQHGLAAPFAGRHGDVVIVAGGCNFPDVPVAEGGTKKYYKDVFVLLERKGEESWIKGAKIPSETAYGASVSLPEGVLCIGGNNNDDTHKSTFLLKWDNTKSKLEIEYFPELPFSLTQMGATLCDNIVYVAGGSADGKPANTFLALDLSKKGSNDFVWKQLDDFPGPARLQPVVVTQNDAEEKHVYVFGGSSYPEDQENPSVTTKVLEYNPKNGQWSEIGLIQPKGYEPFSLHGASGFPTGMNHILFVGGVNYNRFYNAWKQERAGQIAKEKGDTAAINRFNKWKKEYLTHEAPWYKFNKEVLIYHTITKSWTVGDEYPFPPPAGAKAVAWKDGWLIINGETMPGVRSPKVYYGELKAEPNILT